MRKVICSVYDEKLGDFNAPINFDSTGSAIRSFTDEVRRAPDSSGNVLNAHPEDFKLYVIADFDSEVDEKFVNIIPPRLLISGVDC